MALIGYARSRQRNRTPPCRRTRCGRRDASGCSRTRCRAPRPTGPAWPPRWLICATATCWPSGGWIGLAAPAASDRDHGRAGRTRRRVPVAVRKHRHHHLGRATPFSMCSARWASSNAISSANAPKRVGRRRRPRTQGGRKPVVTADKLRRAREYIANGLNVREAAARPQDR